MGKWSELVDKCLDILYDVVVAIPGLLPKL